MIAEYASGGATGSGTSYLTQDHLGSIRLVTDASGNIKARRDYLPFGEEIAANIGVRSSVAGYANSDATRQKFTSKERDNESGLDYFLARYYSAAQGRFTSPDEPFADQNEDDPQSWNLYPYVRNNPLNYTDPFGLWRKEIIDGTEYWIAEQGDGVRDAFQGQRHTAVAVEEALPGSKNSVRGGG